MASDAADTFFDRMLEDETYDLGEDDEDQRTECGDYTDADDSVGVVSKSIEDFEDMTAPDPRRRQHTHEELRTMLQHARARELGQIH